MGFAASAGIEAEKIVDRVRLINKPNGNSLLVMQKLFELFVDDNGDNNSGMFRNRRSFATLWKLVTKEAVNGIVLSEKTASGLAINS